MNETGEAKRGLIAGRDAFMARVSARLGRSQAQGIPPLRDEIGVPEHYKEIKLTAEQNIELFARNWTALSGGVKLVSETEAKEGVAGYLRQISEELGIRRAARWEHEGLLALGIDQMLTGKGIDIVPWKEIDAADRPISDESDRPRKSNTSGRSRLLQSTEQCELGIVWADYAIANTGTLVLLARGGRGRSVSLLPGALFAIVRADQLVTRMGEAFSAIKDAHAQPHRLPSSINLITGPSRSADIENDLTIGVHGPGKVYCVIVVPDK